MTKFSRSLFIIKYYSTLCKMFICLIWFRALNQFSAKSRTAATVSFHRPQKCVHSAKQKSPLNTIKNTLQTWYPNASARSTSVLGCYTKMPAWDEGRNLCSDIIQLGTTAFKTQPQQVSLSPTSPPISLFLKSLAVSVLRSHLCSINANTFPHGHKLLLPQADHLSYFYPKPSIWSYPWERHTWML